MDALIYGITPRAQIENLLKAPPEKMSKNPKRVPLACLNKLKNASPFIPGVGI